MDRIEEACWKEVARIRTLDSKSFSDGILRCTNTNPAGRASRHHRGISDLELFLLVLGEIVLRTKSEDPEVDGVKHDKVGRVDKAMIGGCLLYGRGV